MAKFDDRLIYVNVDILNEADNDFLQSCQFIHSPKMMFHGRKCLKSSVSLFPHKNLPFVLTLKLLSW